MAGQVHIKMPSIQKPDIPKSVVASNSFNNHANLTQKMEGSQSFNEVKKRHSKDVDEQTANHGNVASRFKTETAKHSHDTRRNMNTVYTTFKLLERFYGKKGKHGNYLAKNKTKQSGSEIDNDSASKGDKLDKATDLGQKTSTFDRTSHDKKTDTFSVKNPERTLKVAGKYVKPTGSGGRMMTQKEAFDFLRTKNPNMTLHEMQRNVNHATMRRAIFVAGQGLERISDGASKLHRATVGRVKAMKTSEMYVKIDEKVAKGLFGKEASNYKKGMSVSDARLLLSETYEAKYGKKLDDLSFSQLLKPTMTRKDKFGKLTYRKEKLNTDKVLGVKSDRRFFVSTQLASKKAMKNTLKGGIKRNLDKQRDEQKQDGSFGQYAIADAYDQAVRLKQTGEMTVKGLKVAGKVANKSAEMVVNSGKTVANFVQEGHKTLNEARMFEKDGKGKSSDYLKDKAKKSAQQYKKEAQKKMRDATKKLMEETAKKASQIASKLSAKAIGGAIKGFVTSMVSSIVSAVVSFVTGLIGFITTFGVVIVIALVILVIIFFIYVLTVLQPFTDTNSMQGVKALTEKWEDEYYQEVLADNGNPDPPISMHDRYSQDMNTVTIKMDCDGEDASYRNNFIDYYALLITEYNLDILNMGRDYGNEENTDEGVPSYEEMEAFLKDIFDFMYPSDEVNDSSRIEITTVSDFGVSVTQITIDVATMEDVFVYLGWDEDKIALFGDAKNTLEGVLGELEYDEGYDTSWLDYSTLSNTVYDGMAKSDLDDAMANANLVPVTREAFASTAYDYCFPAGQISYEYGGKDPSMGGLDCSGFVAYMYSLQGVDIGSSTAELWENSYAISKSQLQAGDLVFKQTPNSNGINHVGIYLGEDYDEGKYAHCASSTGTVVNDYSGFIHFRRPILNFYVEPSLEEETE